MAQIVDLYVAAQCYSNVHSHVAVFVSRWRRLLRFSHHQLVAEAVIRHAEELLGRGPPGFDGQGTSLAPSMSSRTLRPLIVGSTLTPPTSERRAMSLVYRPAATAARCPRFCFFVASPLKAKAARARRCVRSRSCLGKDRAVGWSVLVVVRHSPVDGPIDQPQSQPRRLKTRYRVTEARPMRARANG